MVAGRVLGGSARLRADASTNVKLDNGVCCESRPNGRRVNDYTITVDGAPRFSQASVTRTYAVGTRVNWVPPGASGGNGALSYSLSGKPSWLSFAASTRRLSGTVPASADGNSYPMTLTVGDSDSNTAASDKDTLAITFRILRRTYTLTVTEAGCTTCGSVSVSPSAPYYHNTLVTLTAKLEDLTFLDHWQNETTGASHSGETYSFRITQNTTVTAHFGDICDVMPGVCPRSFSLARVARG